MAFVDERDIEFLLNLKFSDINKRLINDLFATKGKLVVDPVTKKSKLVTTTKYEPDTIIIIPKGRYHDNKEPIKTTIGRLIYNKLFIDENFYNYFGYINENVGGSKLEYIEDVLSKALLDDEITVDQFVKYLNTVQWFGFTFNSTFTSSLTIRTTSPLDAVTKLKKELTVKYEKELKEGNAVVASNIEKELLKLAKEELKNDPGMDMFESGSKANFSNNYKAFAVMKGPLVDTSTGKYNISTSNYMEGIKKDELEYFGDSIVNAAYAKGKQTQVAG